MDKPLELLLLIASQIHCLLDTGTTLSWLYTHHYSIAMWLVGSSLLAVLRVVPANHVPANHAHAGASSKSSSSRAMY